MGHGICRKKAVALLTRALEVAARSRLPSASSLAIVRSRRMLTQSGQPPAIRYPPVTADRPRPPGRVSEPGPPSAAKPKLLDRVRDALRARQYSHRTEKAYVHWIRRSLRHSQRSPCYVVQDRLS